MKIEITRYSGNENWRLDGCFKEEPTERFYIPDMTNHYESYLKNYKEENNPFFKSSKDAEIFLYDFIKDKYDGNI